jgi:hypothetical protein
MVDDRADPLPRRSGEGGWMGDTAVDLCGDLSGGLGPGVAGCPASGSRGAQSITAVGACNRDTGVA